MDENHCFAPDGTPLKAVPEASPYSCRGCWFELVNAGCYDARKSRLRPSCTAGHRSDGRSIRWVRDDDPVDPNPL